jgi:hypothetical protein
MGGPVKKKPEPAKPMVSTSQAAEDILSKYRRRPRS